MSKVRPKAHLQVLIKLYVIEGLITSTGGVQCHHKPGNSSCKLNPSVVGAARLPVLAASRTLLGPARPERWQLLQSGPSHQSPASFLSFLLCLLYSTTSPSHSDSRGAHSFRTAGLHPLTTSAYARTPRTQSSSRCRGSAPLSNLLSR